MCKACEERGKDWVGDDPKCAFPDGVTFNTDNWMCATMSKLRNLCEDDAVWNEDQYAAILTGGESQHVILSWYKRRGRTEGAFMLNDGVISPLTLQEAEATIAESDRCSWTYAGSCTFKTSCGLEYVDEMGDPPTVCPQCGRKIIIKVFGGVDV